MSKRKERKARRIKLINEWVLIVAKKMRECKVKDVDISAVILMSHFKSFCILNHIDKPQDKSLRDHILLGANELLKLIDKASENVKNRRDDAN